MANDKRFNAKNGLSVGTTPVNVVDSNGNITANTISGNGQSITSVNATSIDNGTLPATRLPASGVTAGTYGNSSQIPVVTVDTYGRVTGVVNTAVAGVSGFSYTSPNSTFTITTSAGSSYSANIDTIQNLTVQGNLTVLGTTSTVSAVNMSINDNMIYMNNGIAANVTNIVANGTYIVFTANNNFSAGWDVIVTGVTPSTYDGTYNNIFAANSTTFTVASANTGTYTSGGTARGKSDINPDIGFAAGYNDGTYRHTGFFRDASDGIYKVFDQYLPEPDASPYIDTANVSFRIADFQANNTTLGSVNIGGSMFTANSTAANTSVPIFSDEGANAINFTNATANWIGWNTAGVGAPSVTTRSAGTKMVLYPGISAATVDYAIGIEGSHVWFSSTSATSGFKWYSNTTNIMTANVTGLNLNTRALSGVTTAAMGNTTITGFANVTTSIQGGSTLTIAGAASGITTLAAGNTTITGFVNATSSVNSAILAVGTNFTANATAVRMASNSVFSQDTGVGTGSISGILAYNPEGYIATHPFLTNDLANLRLRGGTLTVNTNVALTNTQFDTLFDATPSYTTGFANATANTILEFTLPSTLFWGSGVGISFGASSWAPSYVAIDAYSNGAWVSCYSNTAFTGSQVQATIPGNAGPGTTALRFTMNANTSTRIAGIWGYDYDSDGWTHAAMPRAGGQFYGNVSVNSTSTFSIGTTTINATSYSGTANNATYFGGYTWAAPGALGTSTANSGAFTSLAAGNTTITGFANVISDSAAVRVGNSTNYIAGNTSGFYPVSNTLSNALGSTTQRWAFNGTTGNFSSTLAAGNTTITGFANVTTTLQVGGGTPGSPAITAATSSGGVSLSLTDSVTSTLIVRHDSGSAHPIIGTNGSGLRLAAGGSQSGQTVITMTSGGNTGVGNTAPADKFSVNGTTYLGGNTTITGFANVGTTLQVGTNTATFGTAAYIVANGNFGVGTSSPIRPSHVYYNSSVVGAYTTVLQGATGGYGAGVSFQSVLTGGSLAEMARVTADGESSWNTTTSTQYAGLRFYTARSGTITEAMRLNGDGRLVVGTISPINTNMISAYGANQNGFVAQVSNNAYSLYQGFNSSATLTYQVDGPGNGYFAGNLGVGTSSPANKLHIAGSAGTLLRLDGGASGTGTRDIFISEFDTTAYGGIIRYDSGADTFTFGTVENSTVVNAINVLRTSGNVGIGTTSPVTKLHVAGQVRFEHTGDKALDFVRSGTNTFSIEHDTSRMYFYNASTANTILAFTNDSNVGIGTGSPAYKLEVNGSFAATTKSFVINHPTNEGMKLRYGSLEGPENGVYVRGRLKGNKIELPDYWTGLVDEDTITVNLTPIGKHQKLYVEDISDNTITIANDNLLSKSIDCFYVVYGERKDVEKLVVEF